jgi:hypothetical protein
MNSKIFQSGLTQKGLRSLLPLILMFMFFNLSAQNTEKAKAYQDSLKVIQNEIDYLQKQIDEKQKQVVILQQYLIGEEYKIGDNPTPGKVIQSTTMRSKPDKRSKRLSVELKVNDIVMLYKYIPGDQCWAIKHKGLIGFVPADAIMGISKSDVPDNSTDK